MLNSVVTEFQSIERIHIEECFLMTVNRMLRGYSKKKIHFNSEVAEYTILLQQITMPCETGKASEMSELKAIMSKI